MLEEELLEQQYTIARHQMGGDTKAIRLSQQRLIHNVGTAIVAVKRVTSSSGAKTSGIDGLVWKTGPAKLKAVKSLLKKLKCLDKYKAQPVRRVWIEKENSTEQRPLGIPTIEDRALQQIYLFAMEPIEETRAHEHSYGFRPFRSTDHAIARIRLLLDDRRLEDR